MFFGEFLVNEGVINREQLAMALTEQMYQTNIGGSSWRKLGETMVVLGFLNLGDLSRHLDSYVSFRAPRTEKEAIHCA